MRPPKRSNLKSAEGFINGIEFAISGPIPIVDSILRYIRSVAKAYGGKE